MFCDCLKFNSDLSRWDVSNVRYMYEMFYYCKNFNSDLSTWNVSKVEDISRMFERCDSMKKLPKWFHYSIYEK